ncbi:Type I restriction modification DNA specificity domain-containing protein [Candidatus Electrothrix aarhusensis]
MKGYPTYRDSGVAWIGEVPEHWATVKTKYLFAERVEKGYPAEPLLAATQSKGVVPKSMYKNRTVEAQKDLHLLKLVQPGDFVISLRSFQGGIEYAYFRGIISPAYTVMIPKERILPDYYRHLAKSKEFISLLQTCVTGIREGQNINYEFLKRTPMPVPPRSEQQQIARYLDWQTTQINKFIKAKKKLIALLKEQKQNIINEAVTKGINPDVEMKDSGVEWLGEIPAHWEAIRLKRCTSSIDQGWSPQCEAQQAGKNEWGVLKVGCVNGDHFNARQNKKLPDVLSPRLQCKIQLNDIIVSRANTRDLVGLAALVENDYPNILLCDKLFRFRSRDNIAISKFLVYCIRSSTSREQIEERATGASSSMQNISQSVIRNLCIALPPLNEQLFIVDHIVQESTLIDQTIIRTEREIELIQEYRTRLVSDVVTGKIDVRSVAIPEFEPAETDPNARNDKEPEDELVSLEEAA